MRRAMAAASLVALLLPAAMPAGAGVFDDTEARKEIMRIRDAYGQRLDRLEAGSQAQLELSNQLESMKSEIAKLRGQVEVLTYKLDSIEKRQKDFYVDLDNRLRQIETRAQPAAAKPVDPAAEARDYQAALDLLKAGKYAEAGEGFEKFTRPIRPAASCRVRISGPAAPGTRHVKSPAQATITARSKHNGRMMHGRLMRCSDWPTASRQWATSRAPAAAWKRW